MKEVKYLTHGELILVLVRHANGNFQIRQGLFLGMESTLLEVWVFIHASVYHMPCETQEFFLIVLFFFSVVMYVTPCAMLHHATRQEK
jgi:hypothetical protein